MIDRYREIAHLVCTIGNRNLLCFDVRKAKQSNKYKKQRELFHNIYFVWFINKTIHPGGSVRDRPYCSSG